MRLLLAALLVFAMVPSSSIAALALPVGLPDETLHRISDDSSSPPRGLSDAERKFWRLPIPSSVRAPPVGPVRAFAEYEENDGLLLRWGSYNSVITEIAVAESSDPSIRLWIVVSGASQQASATTTLQSAGANLAQISFITAPSNSVWMRDYGPRFINMAGLRGMVDHLYNRPRPLDDAIPSVIASTFNEPKFDIPLTHGGGNFHLFDDRDAFMTSLIQNENPSLSATQIQDYYREYQGLELTIVPAFPTSFDSTQHIDMWMLPAARKRVIISAYPATGGVYAVPYSATESTATLMQARGYQVIRTPGWQAGGAHYTYANALVLNRQVLMCRFAGEDARNAEALSSFQAAFPTRRIITIDCSSIITASGAIHCIAMHIGQPFVLKSGFED
jgi:agmatine deiminase